MANTTLIQWITSANKLRTVSDTVDATKGTAPLPVTSTGLPASLGQQTSAASTSVVLASDQSAVPVSSSSKAVRVVPTITAGAYSANDVIGGVITFANAARVSGGSGVIQTLVLTCRAAVEAALTIVFFSATPSSAIADNGAFTWGTTDADLALFQGSVDILASDYKTLMTGKRSATLKNIGLEYDCAATSLFAYIIGTGGPTYVAVDDLAIRPGFLRD